MDIDDLLSKLWNTCLGGVTGEIEAEFRFLTLDLVDRSLVEIGIGVSSFGNVPHVSRPGTESLDEDREVDEVDQVEADHRVTQTHRTLLVTSHPAIDHP